MRHEFFQKGWVKLEHDPVLERWIGSALPAARRSTTAPEHARWWRCGGTWFAGVNALGNDVRGSVDGGPPLSGNAVDFIRETLGLSGFPWDSAQVSVCRPGYPKPTEGEGEAAFTFRLKRDAAHIDGIGRRGAGARRFLTEPHGFILGVPLVEADADAAPLVVWEGSHEIVRQVFSEAFAERSPNEWEKVDVTDLYHAARRRVFEACPRVTVAARPGESYLVHRLALHGVAPWAEGARAGPDGRMIAYFRPVTGGNQDWLELP